MKNYVMFSILFELIKKDRVSAKYLSEKYEVCTRTIYRYLDDLQCAGIPTFTKKGKNGGIFLQKCFILEQLVLTKQEQEYIKNCIDFAMQFSYSSSKDLKNLNEIVIKKLGLTNI